MSLHIILSATDIHIMSEVRTLCNMRSQIVTVELINELDLQGTVLTLFDPSWRFPIISVTAILLMEEDEALVRAQAAMNSYLMINYQFNYFLLQLFSLIRLRQHCLGFINFPICIQDFQIIMGACACEMSVPLLWNISLNLGIPFEFYYCAFEFLLNQLLISFTLNNLVVLTFIIINFLSSWAFRVCIVCTTFKKNTLIFLISSLLCVT